MSQFQSWYYRQPPAIRTIVTINLVIFVLGQIFYAFIPSAHLFIREHLAMTPVLPDLLLEPWQLITYNFIHISPGFSGLLHVGFNMLWLFWIGKEYEEMHGTQRTWVLYLVCGVGGGLMCVLLSPLSVGIAGGPNVPVEGASASVLGLVMAVAILYPYKQIGLLFFGVVRLLYVVIGFLIFDALLALTSPGSAVAAHWGGVLTGYLFAKEERGALPVVGSLFGGKKRSSRSRTTDESLGLLDRLERWLGGGPSEDDATETRTGPTRTSRPSSSSSTKKTQSDSEKEIDRILDKISEQGYDALSDEEKRTLYEASQS